MNLHQAFLRAICEDPADDTPRLVFADWLEENGQADRAEVIRLECTFASDLAVARRQDGVGSMRCQLQWYQFWQRRESLPWRTTYSDWRTADFQGWPGPEDCVYRWERGFIMAISLPLDAFLSCAAALFRGAPITRVALSDRNPMPAWPPGGNASGFEVCWMRSTTDVAYSVPPAIYDHLLAGRLPCGNAIRFYEMKPDALENLSGACVAYGRQQAGLPPLPTAVTMEPAAHV